MQATTDSPAAGLLDGLTESEEQIMTFQIALVGCDGLVIGSDRLASYVAASENWRYKLSQSVSERKYFSSDGESLVCFAAGGPRAISLARQISVDSDPFIGLKNAADPEWRDAVNQAAREIPFPQNQQIPDELLIALANAPNAFWLVSRVSNNLNLKVTKIQQHYCAGTPTFAQFLPRHLWSRDRSVSELRKLALLTLSYAAIEQPQSVGPPFDVMTLDTTGHITWSESSKPAHESFQHGLEHLFAEEN